MKRILPILLIVLAATLIPGISISQVIPTNVCDQSCKGRWLSAENETMGVTGEDLTGPIIKGYAAEKFSWVLARNWFPITGSKETFCGTLSKYKWFLGIKLIGPFNESENDRNVYITPTHIRFQRLLEEAKRKFTKPGGMQTCNGKDCVETEITPHNGMFNDLYFPRPKNAQMLKSVEGDTPLLDKQFCVYGPWVFETSHKSRPEVHPAELAWWKDENSNYFFMVIQDDSRRFDRSKNYRRTGKPFDPNVWQPWSKPPREARFRVAFSVPSGEDLEYAITHLAHRNVITKGPGGPFVYDAGTTSVSVQIPDHSDFLDVKFEGVHWNGGLLRGYIVIDDKVGINDRSEEGYHVFVMHKVGDTTANAKYSSIPAYDPSEFPLAAVVAVPGSIRPGLVEGKETIVGDLEFEIQWEDEHHPPPDFKTRHVYLLNADKQRAQELPVHHSIRNKAGFWQGTIEGVPALDGAELQLVSSEEETIYLWIPNLELSSNVSVSPITTEASNAAWESIASPYGISKNAIQQGKPTTFKRASVWDIEIQPVYRGETSDIRSPFAVELARSLRQPLSEMITSFGSLSPVSLDWKFVMSNQTKDQEVRVKEFGDYPAQVDVSRPPLVQRISTTIDGSKLRIWFPDDEQDPNLYQFIAKGTMRDQFGSSHEIELNLYNYVFKSSEKHEVVDASINLASNLSGVSEIFTADLMQAAQTRDSKQFIAPLMSWENNYWRQIQQRQILSLIEYSNLDDMLTIDELQNITEVVRRSSEDY